MRLDTSANEKKSLGNINKESLHWYPTLYETQTNEWHVTSTQDDLDSFPQTNVEQRIDVHWNPKFIPRQKTYSNHEIGFPWQHTVHRAGACNHKSWIHIRIHVMSCHSSLPVPTLNKPVSCEEFSLAHCPLHCTYKRQPATDLLNLGLTAKRVRMPRNFPWNRQTPQE